MKLKESGFDELMNVESHSPKYTKPKMYINENNNSNNINMSLNSKRFLDVGRHTGVPDVDLSNNNNRNFSNSKNTSLIGNVQNNNQKLDIDTFGSRSPEANIPTGKLNQAIYPSDTKGGALNPNRDSSGDLRLMNQNSR